MDLGLYAAERIQPRVVAFEEQLFKLRLFLADCFQEDEAWEEAAKQLALVPLTSSTKSRLLS